MARKRNLMPAAELRECAWARTAEKANCDRIYYAFDMLYEALTDPNEYYNARQLAALAEGLKRGVNASLYVDE